MLFRSLLFVPGNNQKLLKKAPDLPADVIIYDLEDSVPFSEKKLAREQVAEAISQLGEDTPKVFIRVNSSEDLYPEDLTDTVTSKVNSICLPKGDTVKQVKMLDKALSRLEQKQNISNRTIGIVVMFESAQGVLNAHQIAKCNNRIRALSFGAEDLTYNLNVTRTREGHELLFSRNMIKYAAAAAEGIMAIDAVFTDIKDSDGFFEEAKMVRHMGFCGKHVIHPSQVELANQAFSPSEEEITKSKKIIEEFEKASAVGHGVISVDGKMIDLPVVKRARYILELARLIDCNK